MNYGEVISRAWKIFWKQKALWLFNFVCRLPLLAIYFGSAMVDLTGVTVSRSVLIGLILAIGSLNYFLTTFAEISVIRGVKVSRQDMTRVISFREIFVEVHARLGRTLVFNFLPLIILAPLVPLVLSWGKRLDGLIKAGNDLALIPMISLLCILFPLTYIFLFVYDKVMMVSLIVDDLSIKNAIKDGWGIFRRNFGRYLVIGLIIIGITLGFVILAFIPAMCTMGEYMQELFTTGDIPRTIAGQTPWYYNAITLVYNLLSITFDIFIWAIYVVFYMKLTKRPGWKNEQLPEELQQESL